MQTIEHYFPAVLFNVLKFILNQWIVFFVRSDWLLKLGIVPLATGY